MRSLSNHESQLRTKPHRNGMQVFGSIHVEDSEDFISFPEI